MLSGCCRIHEHQTEKMNVTGMSMAQSNAGQIFESYMLKFNRGSGAARK